MKLPVAVLACALLIGCKAREEHAPPAPAPVSTTGAVAVTVDGNGFTPAAVAFKKGAPASLVFTRTSDDTCATEVVFPELDVKQPLPKNTPVTISIPTEKEQKLTFQCGMGMFKSSVVIGS